MKPNAIFKFVNNGVTIYVGRTLVIVLTFSGQLNTNNGNVSIGQLNAPWNTFQNQWSLGRNC